MSEEERALSLETGNDIIVPEKADENSNKNKNKNENKYGHTVLVCLFFILTGAVILTGVLLSRQRGIFAEYNAKEEKRARIVLDDVVHVSQMRNYNRKDILVCDEFMVEQMYSGSETRGFHRFFYTAPDQSSYPIEWHGVRKMCTYLSEDDKMLTFTDENADFLLRISAKKSGGIRKDNPGNKQKNWWLRQIKGDFTYPENGYFAVESAKTLCTAVIEVASERYSGFYKLEYHLDADVTFVFLYLEEISIYDKARAKGTIESMNALEEELRLKRDECRIEIDAEDKRLFKEDVLQGSFFDIASCVWENDSVNTEICATADTRILFGQEEMDLPVIVQDTVAPRAVEKERLLFEGDVPDAEWFEGMNCLTDASGPVKVNSVKLKESVLTPDANETLLYEVEAEDSAGNVANCEFSFKVVSYGDLPIWFAFLDQTDETVMERVRNGELKELEEEYFANSYYSSDSLDLKAAESGYKKAVCHHIDVEVESEEWYGAALAAFYEGLDTLPENMLQEYGEQNWGFYLCDEPLILDELECAGITHYSEELIEITLNCMYGYRDILSTTMHEAGHFIDWNLGFESVGNDVLMEQMKNVCLLEEYGMDPERMNDYYDEEQDVLYHNYTEGGYRYYSFTSSSEFFADSVYYYCEFPEEMQRECPEIYTYIKECLE